MSLISRILRHGRDTSVDAFYQNADNFDSMNDRIMAYMRSHQCIRTRAEIADALGISTSTMSGRIRDLLDKGDLAEDAGRYTCHVTRNRVRGVYAAGRPHVARAEAVVTVPRVKRAG